MTHKTKAGVIKGILSSSQGHEENISLKIFYETREVEGADGMPHKITNTG